jgi:hypothetical protein
VQLIRARIARGNYYLVSLIRYICVNDYFKHVSVVFPFGHGRFNNTPLPSLGAFVSFIGALLKVETDGILCVRANTVSFLSASAANASTSESSDQTGTSVTPRKRRFHATLGIADISKQTHTSAGVSTPSPVNTSNLVLTQNLGTEATFSSSSNGNLNSDE